MKSGLFVWVITVLLGVAFAQAPGACSGACQGTSHDPTVIRRQSDGRYFRFSTGNRIQIATAPDVSGPWTLTGSVVPAGSSINIDGRNDLWAPDVYGPIGGYYYLYYSVSTFGSQRSAIGVARSTTMDAGSWQDLGASGVASSPGSAYNAIDSNLVQGTDGYYLSFGSFWGDLYQVKMGSTPTKTAGTSSYQIAYKPSGSHDIEAPFIYPRSGYYYLFYSEGQCCGYDGSRPAAGQEYRIKVCRSTSHAGPFVDKNGVNCRSGGGTVVLQSHDYVYGPGGQSVFADPNRGTVLVYHYVDTRVGFSDGQKKFGWNVLTWSTGWPVAV